MNERLCPSCARYDSCSFVLHVDTEIDSLKLIKDPNNYGKAYQLALESIATERIAARERLCPQVNYNPSIPNKASL